MIVMRCPPVPVLFLVWLGISFQLDRRTHRHYSPHNRVNCLTLIMGVSSFDSFG